MNDFRCAAIKCDEAILLIILALFENKSSKPISVNYIELIGNSICRCDVIPKFVGTIRNTVPEADGDAPYLRYIESAKFPINIAGNQSAVEYISFRLPNDFKLQNIKLYTQYGFLKVAKKDHISQVRYLLEEVSLPKINYHNHAQP